MTIFHILGFLSGALVVILILILHIKDKLKSQTVEKFLHPSLFPILSGETVIPHSTFKLVGDVVRAPDGTVSFILPVSEDINAAIALQDYAHFLPDGKRKTEITKLADCWVKFHKGKIL